MAIIHKKNGMVYIDGVCRKCGDARLNVGEGTPPHKAKYTCDQCGTFAGWVSEVDLFILSIMHNASPLNEVDKALQNHVNTPIGNEPNELVARIVWDKKKQRLEDYLERFKLVERFELTHA